jgi:hypothetical protein
VTVFKIRGLCPLMRQYNLFFYMQTFQLPSSKCRQRIKEVGGMVATFITSLCEFITISNSVACRRFVTAEEIIPEFSFDTLTEAKTKNA